MPSERVQGQKDRFLDRAEDALTNRDEPCRVAAHSTSFAINGPRPGDNTVSSCTSLKPACRSSVESARQL